MTRDREEAGYLSGVQRWTDYVFGTFTSQDGTQIGHRQIGHGPGIILVQGAMGIAHNYDQLARALAEDFTVYVPDRRGRGRSPKRYGPDHSIEHTPLVARSCGKTRTRCRQRVVLAWLRAIEGAGSRHAIRFQHCDAKRGPDRLIR